MSAVEAIPLVTLHCDVLENSPALISPTIYIIHGPHFVQSSSTPGRWFSTEHLNFYICLHAYVSWF